MIYRCLIGKDSVTTARPVPSIGDLADAHLRHGGLSVRVRGVVRRADHQDISSAVICRHGKFGLPSSIGDPFRRTLCCRAASSVLSRRGRLWQDHSRPDGVNSSQREAPGLLEHCTRRLESYSPYVSPIASWRHGFGRDGVWIWSLQAQPPASTGPGRAVVTKSRLASDDGASAMWQAPRNGDRRTLAEPWQVHGDLRSLGLNQLSLKRD